jgi:hypothetical protein
MRNEPARVAMALTEWHRARRPAVPPRMPHLSATVDGRAVMCPSYPLDEGTGVICVVSEQGTEWLPEVVAPDDPRVRRPGATVRTTGPCRRSGCAYWWDGCQLGGLVASVSDGVDVDDVALPTCPIRDRCRWWLEHGASACASCDGLVRFLAAD